MPLHPQTRLEVWEGNVFDIAPVVAKDVEHPLRAGVVERVNDDERVALAVWMRGETQCDSVASALVVVCVGEVMLIGEVVIEKDDVVVARG